MSSANVEPLNNKHMHLYMLSMGKVFRVLAIADSDDEANEIMARNPLASVIGCDARGRSYLAERYGSVAPSEILADAQGQHVKRLRMPRVTI